MTSHCNAAGASAAPPCSSTKYNCSDSTNPVTIAAIDSRALTICHRRVTTVISAVAASGANKIIQAEFMVLNGCPPEPPEDSADISRSAAFPQGEIANENTRQPSRIAGHRETYC